MKTIIVILALVVFPFLIMSAFNAAPQISPVVIPFNFNPFGNGSGPPIGHGTTNITRISLETSFQSSPNHFPSFSVPFPQIPFLTIWEFLLIIVLIVSVIGVVVRTTSARRIRSFPLVEDDEQKDREDVARVLDAAIAQLKKGFGYRETVLECYRQISEILERKSMVEGKMLTAREFRDTVSRKLNLVSSYLDEATDLFEVARYSRMEITKIEAVHASECLSNLSNLLKSGDLTQG